jgi:hypothetical protein
MRLPTGAAEILSGAFDLVHSCSRPYGAAVRPGHF